MIDLSKINIANLPKVFCDGAFGGFDKEQIFFCFTSGTNVTSFATNPQMYKEIFEWMQRSVKLYEEKHGEIKINHEIPSPFQFGDLGKK